jgi:SAM-dependent methyltransferase
VRRLTIARFDTATNAFRAYQRRLRLALPQPWSRFMGAIAHPTSMLPHADARREFREEGMIEKCAGRSVPFGPATLNLSERVVEVPWALARIPPDAMKVLDVGTAYAPIAYRRLLHRLPVEEVHAVDLAPIEDLVKLRTHIADVRSLPFPDHAFDVAICISTLEHIGLDTSAYAWVSDRTDLAGDLLALRELRRVTQPGGRILVTVPAGVDENKPTYRQYSPRRWERLVGEAGLAPAEIEYFCHAPNWGWNRVAPDAVTSRRYGDGAPYAAAIICSSLAR